MRIPLPLLRLLAFASIAMVSFSAPAFAEPERPAGAASAPAAGVDDAVVTAKNVIASERYWPYHVALIEAWKPAGRTQALPKGSRGVLIRVETSGLARIDFGRDGQHEVPLGATDLLANANRVRRGEIKKMAANFALAIGPRLVSSSASPPPPFGFDEAAAQRGFLCVFADPNTDAFGALAKSLAPLAAHPGVLTVVFPQSARADSEIAERLRALAWPVPFVLDHLSEAYTRTLLPEKSSLPSVLLVTNEGRLVYQATWQPDRATELKRALDEAFGVSGPAR